jgi:large subunit ribosomal protein L10
MNKSEKEQAVAELHEMMKKATFAAAVAYDKLDANTTIELRKAMRNGKIDYKVVKNTLATRAAQGTSVEKITGAFTGPVAIALGYGDIGASAKVCNEAFKKATPEKIKVKTVVADGDLYEGAAGLDTLAKLPGLPELRATLLALINTPATTLVRLINTPGEQLARVIKANADKQGESTAA